DEHRQVLVAGRIGVWLPHDAGHGCSDAADEERRHVRLLPAGEVGAQDDRDLRLELPAAAQGVFNPGPATSSTSSGRRTSAPRGTSAAITAFLSAFRRSSRGGFSLRCASPHCRSAVRATLSSRPLAVSRYSKRGGRSLYWTRSRIPPATNRLSGSARTFRATPRLSWSWSNRRRPRKTSRTIRSVQRSPTTSSVLAIEQFWPS